MSGIVAGRPGIQRILFIDCRGTACRAPTNVERFGKPVPGLIPTICRFLKSAATKQVNDRFGRRGSIWHRNYHEHIIRNEKELNLIRQYIIDNPLKWELDRENPNAKRGEQPEPWEG